MIRIADFSGATSLLMDCLFHIERREFHELALEGKAGPSTPLEYQEAYDKYTKNIKIDPPQKKVIEQIELIPTKQNDRFRIEVDLLSDDKPTDITLIFYLLSSGNNAKHVFLYDIRVM